MVKDTGKTTSPSNVRPLNQPVPLSVKISEDGSLLALRLRGKWLNVESVDDKWRIIDEWWRGQSVSRLYYECVVDGGIRITVFQDLMSTRWYLQKV